MTPELRKAQEAQWLRDEAEIALSKAVQRAIYAGVPIYTLAKALGVSRTRIRTLAR